MTAKDVKKAKKTKKPTSTKKPIKKPVVGVSAELAPFAAPDSPGKPTLKNEKKVAALKKVIGEQKALGAVVSEEDIETKFYLYFEDVELFNIMEDKIMKQLKKTLAVLLVFALAITGINIGMTHVEAENPLTVYGDAVTVAPGKEVKIPIKVKDNYGVAGLALKVTYDASVMTPAKAEKGSLLSGLANLQFGDTIANHTENSFECVAYNDSNFSNNGELMVLTFQMAENVSAGSYALKLELTEHYNEVLTDIEAGCEEIKVTVGNDHSTDTPAIPSKPGVSAKPSVSSRPQVTAKPSNNYSWYDDPAPKPKKKKARKVTNKPSRVKIAKIKNIGKGKAKVTWKKVKCNYKYRVEVSYNKQFSGVRWYDELSKSKKTYTFKTNVLRKFSSKKVLYVRIRAINYGYASKYADYKKRLYGKWSKLKKVNRK